MRRAALVMLWSVALLMATPSMAYAAETIAAFLIAQGVSSFISYVVAYAASSIASSLVMSAFSGKKSNNSAGGFQAQTRENKQVVRSAVTARRIIYGRQMVSGPLLYAESTDDQNTVLHLVVALAGHECEAIDEVWLGDKKLGTLSASGQVLDGYYSGSSEESGSDAFVVPGTLGFGVTHNEEQFLRFTEVYDNTDAAALTDASPAAPGPGQYSHVDGTITFHASAAGHSISTTYKWTDPFVVVKKHLGTADQEADSLLVAESGGKWTTAHRGRGICYVYCRLRINQNNNKFATGIPNVRCVVRGKKLYDPRTGFTVWSDNAALAVRDYLAGADGVAADPDEIDDAYTIAAANACDERVAMAATALDFTAAAATDLCAFAADDPRFANGDGVTLTSTGTLPAGLALATTYYVIRESAREVKLATSPANAAARIAINITGAGTGVHTMTHADQARYTCNAVVNLSDKPRDIIPSLNTAMAGTVCYTQGKYRIFAGAYTAPTVTLTAADLREDLTVRTRVARRDAFNRVRGTFVDPARSWEATDFPAVENSLYEAEDGEQITRDIELPATTDYIRAQRLAKIVLEKSRQGMVVEFPAKLTAFKLSVWDTVNVQLDQLGFTPKVFRVIGWKAAVGQFGGVDLVLQEESAASYAWAFGDATLYDPAPDTTLPNPFEVDAPGPPAVVESLYETTGSAGVKSRATVSWAASDGFAVSYQLEFQPGGAGPWTVLPLTAAVSLALDDLAPGTYRMRVKAFNGFGASSPYAPDDTGALVEILGLTAPPADVTGFSVIKSGGVGIAQFSLHGDLDVRIGGRIVVRHSPDTSGVTWEQGIIVEEFNGDAVSGLVPLMTGTYMAKARDSSGNWSTNAVSFVATEGMVTGFTVAYSTTQHPAFTGGKTNVVKIGSVIQLDSATLIDAMATSIDAWPYIDSIGGVSGTGRYNFDTYVDCGSSATRRFEADVRAQSFDSGDLIDSRLGNIDTWDSMEGTTVNDCDVTLYVETTDDNPAGSPTWGPRTPFFVGDFTCRAARFSLDFVSGDANHNIKVDTLKVDIKVPV